MIRKKHPKAVVTIDRPEYAISGNRILIHCLAASRIGTAYSTPGLPSRKLATSPGSTGETGLDSGTPKRETLHSRLPDYKYQFLRRQV